MTPHDNEQAGSPEPAAARTARDGRIAAPVAIAAGIVLQLLTNHARTLTSFASFVRVCPGQFCDFVDYYYPMGEAVFRTAFPVEGFLYSPFVAVLLAVFPVIGLNASLVLWGILQAVAVSLCVLLFRRLVPGKVSIHLLFAALIVSSYASLLNLMGGSVSVFMTAAILGLLVASGRGHRAAAAGLLAFATSFKFYPIIFLTPFAARRDTRFVLFAAGACGAVLFVIPGVLLGPGDTVRFYGALFDAYRHSDWVVTNPHSQFFPHVVLRLLDPAGPGGSPHLWLLRWISYGVAATNAGVVFLVQRARVRHGDLWSFQLLVLTIPFVLKTSWPGDFVLLSCSQAFLAWWLLDGEKAASASEPAERPADARARETGRRARTAVACCALVVSIGLSNDACFSLVGDRRYGFYGFSFWADLLLLMGSYLVLLPPLLRRLRGAAGEDGGRARANSW